MILFWALCAVLILVVLSSMVVVKKIDCRNCIDLRGTPCLHECKGLRFKCNNDCENCLRVKACDHKIRYNKAIAWIDNEIKEMKQKRG